MKTKKITQLAFEEGKRLLASVGGAFLYALGINMFVVPAGIYTGGLMGICQIARTVLVDYLRILPASFDIAGVLYYMVNIPILVIAWFAVDRKFVIRTLLNVSFMTLFLSILPTVSLLGGDVITSCLVGGVIAGTGTGLTLWAGCTGGGMDVISTMISRRKKNFSIGKINLMINCTLYCACLFLFDVSTAIYSVVYSVLYSFALDKFHFQNINVEVIVITKIPIEALAKQIMQEMGRGITELSANGAYSGKPVNMLYIVISKFEIHQLRAIIRSHDPSAFVTIKEHTDVYGNYVKKI